MGVWSGFCGSVAFFNNFGYERKIGGFRVKYDKRKEEYQAPCLAKIKEAREGGTKKALVVMASGMGKTIVSARDVQDFLQTTEGRTLYLCHNNDILEQARDEYMSVFGSAYSYGIYNGVEKHLHRTDFLFASFQTMKEHKEKFARDEFAYIVVDEAHHIPATTFRRTLEYFEPEFTLGLTATPDRFDRLDITVILGEVVYSMDLIEAIAGGYLASLKVDYMMDEVLKLGRLLDKDNNERVSLKELNKQVFAPRRDEDIVNAIAEKVKTRKDPRMIVYCRTIRHAERIAALISGAVLYHSDAGRLSSGGARQNLQAFRDGAAKTIVVVDRFNEGIDVPEANVLVFLRQTVSPTVFYQQLGRGLRLAEEKTDVLVLDFIANCERILMWEEMRGEIEKIHPDEYKQEGSKRTRQALDEAKIVTNFDRSEFQSRRVELIEAIERARRGASYDKNVLLDQLRKKVASLGGRTPSRAEVRQDKAMADPDTFDVYFGTFENALVVAGFTPDVIKFNLRYADDELIAQMRKKAKELGRTPMREDVDDDPEMASSVTYHNHFGTFTKALITAGLMPARPMTKESIMAQLQRKAGELGRRATFVEIDADDTMTSSHTIKRAFGSLDVAYEAAGVAKDPDMQTREILVAQMQEKIRQLMRSPTQKEVLDDASMASPKVFARVFGSWENALIVVGAKAVRKRPSRKTVEVLLSELRAKTASMGRVPTKREVDADDDMSSSTVYRKQFGSWNGSLEAAGLRGKEEK